ncbi:hypothetical protein E4T44_04933 [Aureobasidium sp. EXF-8845]|nr:hypothetical protein E4T44_04933 [Aureobasidium sp. EXF-8845]
MSTETQTRQKTSTGIRKKPFAVPPVKVACLSWYVECIDLYKLLIANDDALTSRSSRIRCDGKEPCSGVSFVPRLYPHQPQHLTLSEKCNNRGKECIYVQSRRGGARVPRSKRQECVKYDHVKIAQECELRSYGLLDMKLIVQLGFDDAVPTMVQPGGGLTQLDLDLDNTNTLFDNIFPAVSVPQPIGQEDDTLRQTGSVRVYRSDEDILDAYYTWLHPYFPILPPAQYSQPKDNPHLWFPESSELAFESLSPTGLAISAILALIPHSEDPTPFEVESITARRETSHLFAKRTLECMETDSELPNSSVSPAQALLDDHSHISRPCFHPCVPIELETVVALSILSVYEYAQRGNISKMRDRAGQALMRAMDLSLHDRETESDVYTEARRRVWWMTASIVSSTVCVLWKQVEKSRTTTDISQQPPAIPLFDPRFTTDFPQSPDPEAWPFFIKSQQTILLATRFVTAVSLAVEGKGDWKEISTQMQELHDTIEPLISQTNQWQDIQPCSTNPEAVVAYSLKQMSKIKLNRQGEIHSARIKLHRYCAFYDIPVFSETHCDLKKSAPRPVSSSFATTSDYMDLSRDTSPSGSCGCGSSLPTRLPSLGTSMSTSVSPGTSVMTPASTTSSDSATTEYLHPFPFSNHVSSKLCLRSALAIANAFEALPLPASGGVLVGLTPRTMPSFACCAMQSAYTLLMIYHRTWVQQQQQQQQQQQDSLLQDQHPTPLQQSHVQHAQESQFLSHQSPSPRPVIPKQAQQQEQEQEQAQQQEEAQEQAQEQAQSQSQVQNPSFTQKNSQTQTTHHHHHHHQLLTKCEKGLLTIVSALDNYSIAFEALGGMKDQVRLAIDCLDL